MALCSTTATQLKTTSKGFKILKYIAENNGATKYECLKNVLKMPGSKSDLRGYYSCTFLGWKRNRVVAHNKSNYEYSLTAYGYELLKLAEARG